MNIPDLALDYWIWLVALLLYAADSIYFLSGNRILFSVSSSGRHHPIWVGIPFTVLGRQPVLAPLARPWEAVCVAKWGVSWKLKDTVICEMEELRKRADGLGPLEALVAAAFGTLFVVGPAYTYLLGLDVALRFVGVAMYALIVLAAAIALSMARPMAWSKKDVAITVAECLVCPALAPNFVRKLTSKWPVGLDAGQICVDLCQDRRCAQFAEWLKERIRSDIDEIEMDPAEHLHWQSYLRRLEQGK